MTSAIAFWESGRSACTVSETRASATTIAGIPCAR